MRKTLVAGALAALTLAVGGAALAQQSPERPHARAMRADTDGDQRLNRAEFVDARVQRLTWRIAGHFRISGTSAITIATRVSKK